MSVGVPSRKSDALIILKVYSHYTAVSFSTFLALGDEVSLSYLLGAFLGSHWVLKFRARNDAKHLYSELLGAYVMGRRTASGMRQRRTEDSFKAYKDLSVQPEPQLPSAFTTICLRQISGTST